MAHLRPSDLGSAVPAAAFDAASDSSPDLDHHNPELRASLIDWLNWLKSDLGFEGWRFDFVRGYAAKYVKE